MERLLIGAHAVRPVLSVGCEVRMPDEGLKALGLTALVDHGHSSVGIITLGEGGACKSEDVHKGLEELHDAV
jgi:hypothetical protein